MTTKPPSSSAPAAPKGAVPIEELATYIDKCTDPLERLRYKVQLDLTKCIQAEIERGTMNGQEVGPVVDAVAGGVAASAYAFIHKTVQATSDNQCEYDEGFPQALGHFNNVITSTFVQFLQMFAKPKGTIAS